MKYLVDWFCTLDAELGGTPWRDWELGAIKGSLFLGLEKIRLYSFACCICCSDRTTYIGFLVSVFPCHSTESNSFFPNFSNHKKWSGSTTRNQNVIVALGIHTFCFAHCYLILNLCGSGRLGVKTHLSDLWTCLMIKYSGDEIIIYLITWLKLLKLKVKLKVKPKVNANTVIVILYL